MYEHTQKGTLPRVALGSTAVLMAYLAIVTGGRPVAVAGTAFFVALLLLFHSLTVQVSADVVSLRFGVGVVHKEFAVRRIEKAEVVTNPWYYGWGIRLTPRGWLYNVSGFSAVEVTLDGGRRVRIGTDRPEDLLAAIARAIGGADWR